MLVVKKIILEAQKVGLCFAALKNEHCLDDQNRVRLSVCHDIEVWIMRQKINQREEAFLGRFLAVMCADHAMRSGKKDFFIADQNESWQSFLRQLNDMHHAVSEFCQAVMKEMQNTDEMTPEQRIVINRMKNLFKEFDIEHKSSVLPVVFQAIKTNISSLIAASLNTEIVAMKFDDERTAIQRGILFEQHCDDLDLKSRHVAVLLNLPSRTIRDFCSHRQNVPKNLLQKLKSLDDEKVSEVLTMSVEELSKVK